eukprot:PhF_6_TR31534/c0_g1_i2/m.46500/K01110/PTEN; phosphatidylinositol-3,4,5-trisphosphate 3-phosphatase and dual-specificity protein phosphatase PTEN
MEMSTSTPEVLMMDPPHSLRHPLDEPHSPLGEKYSGVLWKFSTGSGMWGTKNWRERWFVADGEGLHYYEKKGDEKAKGIIAWDCVTNVMAEVTPAQHEAAVGQGCFFALYFKKRGLKDEYALLLKAVTDSEREGWLCAIGCYIPKIMEQILGDLEEDDDDDAMTTLRPEATLRIPTHPEPRRRSFSEKLADAASNIAARTVQQVSSRVAGASLRLRELVSKKKLRFKRDGFDLDLVYVTPRIIAMGFPAIGREAVYRNSRADVEAFLKFYHSDKFRVYNLCSERTYTSEAFGGKFVHYPFRDHNPPPLSLFEAILVDMHTFLHADPANVVAVHCKAGKGRTGTVIAAYLVYSGFSPTSIDALDTFGHSRTRNGHGVTIPSQRRYVHYAAQLLPNCSLPPVPIRAITIKIEALHLHATPRIGLADIFAIVTNGDKLVCDTRTHTPASPKQGAGETSRVITISGGIQVSGDVNIEIFETQAIRGAKKVCGAW